MQAGIVMHGRPLCASGLSELTQYNRANPDSPTLPCTEPARFNGTSTAYCSPAAWSNAAFRGVYDQAMVYEIVNQGPEPLTGMRTGVRHNLGRHKRHYAQTDRRRR